MRWKWVIVAILLPIAAAAAYADFVLDIRTPHSSLEEAHGVTSSVNISLGDYQEAMKKKYGPDAETQFTSLPARVTTTVGGKVVEEGAPPSTFGDARGVFAVGPHGHLDSLFPFQINPRSLPETGRRSLTVASAIKSRLDNRFPAKYLNFDEQDFSTDRCITLSVNDLGWLGALLRFRGSTFCVVFWKGNSPGSMLIGVTLADGDPWMRPFTRRLCRWLTTTALARVTATDHEPPPDYAACMLVDRPDRSGARETLQTYVYDVSRNGTLAYMD